MKGIGNYSSVPVPQVERQAGTLVAYLGPRATVTMRGGATYSVPSAPFRLAEIAEHAPFFMTTTRVANRITEVRVTKPPPARPPMERRATPKVYVREGTRIATRPR